MNVAKKLEYAKAAVESIARHDDESTEVRKAAFQHLVAVITYETHQMDIRHKAKTAAKIAALTPKELA